jgi:hypothetical protein
MPICKNHKDKTYKGTESSPLGRGYSAYGDKNGKKRVGNDGDKWVASNQRWTKRGAHRIYLSERIAKDMLKNYKNKK